MFHSLELASLVGLGSSLCSEALFCNGFTVPALPVHSEKRQPPPLSHTYFWSNSNLIMTPVCNGFLVARQLRILRNGFVFLAHVLALVWLLRQPVPQLPYIEQPSCAGQGIVRGDIALCAWHDDTGCM